MGDYETLTKSAEETFEKYDAEKDVKDHDLVKEDDGMKDAPRDWVMQAGQSRRIWNELYKVVDSSDVVLQVSTSKRRHKNKQTGEVGVELKKIYMTPRLQTCDISPNYSEKMEVCSVLLTYKHYLRSR